MSEAADKIAKILEDPESIKMISEIAESFLGGGNTDSSASFSDKNEFSESRQTDVTLPEKSQSAVSSGETLLRDSFASIGGLQKIISSTDIENTVRLISALRPYMSNHRRESADSVLKMLNVIKILGKTNISELSKLFGIL